ncbi:CsiV family protein [Marinobacter zhanjiangensis]|uniref:Peptidoglycan-binding protein, CsiV n=1 Tax=Marinobacter zhanjiangensis TaxID=578215 RepID=A0ABQ3AR55_9GAMM|nr:CsiV family protein [Marinobacter zhanjiangensis]GGY64054.1 hypothetical protein GCM10007071_08340 [Marinobacter zhanjiangensis]
MYKPAFNSSGRLFAALALLVALAAPALAEDRYRAEVVVLERLADPIVKEQMADKAPEVKEGLKRLWVVDPSGTVRSDLDITSNLTLNTAASRLENSGKYRVLMKTGWIQQFPPDYDGKPLLIEVGELLEEAGHRAVEGTIEINRRRYLLVNVELNHWRNAADPGADGERDGSAPESASPDTGEGTESTESTESTENDGGDGTGADTRGVGTSPASSPGMKAASGKELVTWIREIRRMRSEEIHFLDSPTIGVLVYFRPLD